MSGFVAMILIRIFNFVITLTIVTINIVQCFFCMDIGMLLKFTDKISKLKFLFIISSMTMMEITYLL